MGHTPLYTAALRNAAESVQILCQHGADVNFKDEDDWTLLHFAVRTNAKDTVRILCQHGADINAKN